MKKYFAIYLSGLKNALEYRASLLTWILVELMSLISAIFIWSAVYRTYNQVGSYMYSSMMTYYFLIPLVGAFTSVHFSEKIPRKIKDGELSIDLIRPYSPLLGMVANQLAIKSVQNTLKIPAYVIIGSLMYHFFDISFQFPHLIAGLIICIFAYVLHVILDLSISLFAFWFDDSWSLSLLKHVAFMIFGGLSFPIDLVPQSVQVIFRILPFDLIYYLPVTIMMGRINPQTSQYYLIKFLTWTILLSILLFTLWKTGIKKYHAYGQ